MAQKNKRAMSRKNKSSPSPQRHSRDCRLCAHPERESIEKAFIAWRRVSQIAKDSRLQRSTIYLHAAAMGLMNERRANIRGALEAFIERSAQSVRPSAASFVTACVALSKLNERGETIDRVALSRSGTELFQDFTIGELEDFAREGIVPARHANSRLSATEKTRNVN
jgi:hypothetical protein